jgi:hypothetical protein
MVRPAEGLASGASQASSLPARSVSVRHLELSSLLVADVRTIRRFMQECPGCLLAEPSVCDHGSDKGAGLTVCDELWRTAPGTGSFPSRHDWSWQRSWDDRSAGRGSPQLLTGARHGDPRVEAQGSAEGLLDRLDRGPKSGEPLEQIRESPTKALLMIEPRSVVSVQAPVPALSRGKAHQHLTLGAGRPAWQDTSPLRLWGAGDHEKELKHVHAGYSHTRS